VNYLLNYDDDDNDNDNDNDNAMTIYNNKHRRPTSPVITTTIVMTITIAMTRNGGNNYHNDYSNVEQ